MIKTIIQNLVENPNDHTKQEYLNHVHSTEHSLLHESEKLIFKSQEYFDKRNEAFSYRKKCAIMLLNQWVEKYKTSDGCLVTYADTLNIPFQQIK
jgi:hypothetical protein